MDKFFEYDKYYSTQKVQPFKTYATVQIKNEDKEVIGMFMRNTDDGHNKMRICDPDGKMLAQMQSEDGDTSLRVVKKMLEITDGNENVIAKVHAKNAMGATWYIDSPSGENLGEVHVGLGGEKILDTNGEQIASIGMSAGGVAKRLLTKAKSWNVTFTKKMDQEKNILFKSAGLLLSVLLRYPTFIR